MPSIEEKFAEAKEEVGSALPTLEPESETDPARESESERNARREELKKNLASFVEHDDMEGLLAFVERMAHFDMLTNTLNRTGFIAEAEPRMDDIAKLPEGFNRRTDEFQTFNVLFLDLDKFKAINDEYGHGAGDAALVKTAEVLRSTLRDDDIIGRWGGEEFVVAFTCSSKKNQIKRHRYIVAEKVRAALERAVLEYEGKRIPLTASVGVAERKPQEELLEEVVRRADEAMYAAKNKGRNQVAIAEEEGILPEY